jgi:hypothetical protein
MLVDVEEKGRNQQGYLTFTPQFKGYDFRM